MIEKDFYSDTVKMVNWFNRIGIIAAWYIENENTLPTIVIKAWNTDDDMILEMAEPFVNLLFKKCTSSYIEDNEYTLIFEGENPFNIKTPKVYYN